MIVLGIDPGSTVTAYGVVESKRGRLRYITSGHIRTTADIPIPIRLATIYEGLVQAIAAQPLDAISIEAIFTHRSSESALRLGQARGVALLAAAQAGHIAHEYNAMTVKKTVAGSGRADKAAVARMVKMLLGVEPKGPKDISDALAIAITHCQNANVRRAIEAIQ